MRCGEKAQMVTHKRFKTNDDADVQRGKRFGALITLKHVADLSVVGIVRGGTLTVGHRHTNLVCSDDTPFTDVDTAAFHDVFR